MPASPCKSNTAKSAPSRLEREIVFLALMHTLREQYLQSIPWNRQSLLNLALLAVQLADE
jgi:hypothetical protein